MRARIKTIIAYVAAGLVLPLSLAGCVGGEFNATDTETETETGFITVETTESVSKTAETETVTSVSEASKEEEFYVSPITDEIFARIDGKSFSPDCTLSRDELRYLHLLHKDIDGREHEGEMIVNRHIAEDVLDIFKQLYEADYPIEKVCLIDEYGADDEASMEDNNSSSFNFRYISHTNIISKHGYGLAVDINTLYNPYSKKVHGKNIVEPVTGEAYLDRTKDFPYKIERGDLCYTLFTQKGFEWGGDWGKIKDYQHFEISDDVQAQWYP